MWQLLCCLQVDGLGNALIDFDDPNLPSLLAMPLLGFEYDPQVRGPGSTLQPAWLRRLSCKPMHGQMCDHKQLEETAAISLLPHEGTMHCHRQQGFMLSTLQPAFVQRLLPTPAGPSFRPSSHH